VERSGNPLRYVILLTIGKRSYCVTVLTDEYFAAFYPVEAVTIA